MAASVDPTDPRPVRVLVRDLLLVTLLAVTLYALFTVFNDRFLHGFTQPEIILLEAGAIVLVAFAVARSLTAATNAVLRRRGQVNHGHTVRIFLNLLIGVAVVLALFKLAGVSAESIFLGSAFAGIVLGLAAQTVLANVFAGLLLVLANPFRPGDRVSFISSSYGAIAPSYPHEMMYPSYSGVVIDVGLIYTVLSLDGGGLAKVPNSVVLGALVLQPRPGVERSVRVRMTFPLAVSVASVESALPKAIGVPQAAQPPFSPKLEVVDVSATTWDAAVSLWGLNLDEGAIRDRILRAVLAAHPNAAPAGESAGGATA
jgi:small-conductance mechanosensitive channel